MSFLDDLPLDWTKAETRELHRILSAAFSTQKSVKQITEKAGLPPEDLPFAADTVRELWHETMNTLRKRDQLRTLLEKAVEDRNAKSYHEPLQRMLDDADIPVSSREAGEGKPSFWEDEPVTEDLYLERLLANGKRLLPVTLLGQLSVAAQSVAKLFMQFNGHKAYGTGFLVTKNLLLTNHHNVHIEFDHRQQGKKIYLAENIVAEFEVNGETVEVSCSRYQTEGEGEYLESEEHDWALLQLKHPIEGVDPLNLGSRFDVQERDFLVIIQHPGGGEKQFALEHEAVRGVTDLHVQYLAETDAGSSGSPVLNDRMEVVALHRAAFCDIVDVDGENVEVWYNLGVR
ncbi:MAG TPA: hypothetical protein DCE42_16215, partial [Myxococcales bacterium]|nr:hypothetical protein [Myxococcales bacterium]